ncbi:hypothetical protein HH214_18410 [Mucilaginibacter robiniae]|uniref:Uncharacterized protein n=1 Tax=Mucilaginibacter robiniae TaxID=2728022 RepID=A0A7L5E3N7_9SPHI|nr:hypothetical protein [Mucilaginibacter robiniae]QJD97705.1 hypothetical protein HH214_18410 [Mucilaginibacter robiniae]
MKIPKLILLLDLLLAFGCKQNSGNKAVAIFVDPGGVMKIANRHVQVYLNHKKLVDTSISADDLHPDNAKILKCFDIDSTKVNLLLVRINSKEVKLDLNRYTSQCLNIHATYDDVTVLNKIIKEADDDLISTKHITLDVKRFTDSLIATYPDKKFDTLMYQVDLKNCPCQVK